MIIAIYVNMSLSMPMYQFAAYIEWETWEREGPKLEIQPHVLH